MTVHGTIARLHIETQIWCWS